VPSAELRTPNHAGLALRGTAKHTGLPHGSGEHSMAALELLGLLGAITCQWTSWKTSVKKKNKSINRIIIKRRINTSITG
jgi:hypothetical protein